jgi:hypothetical protein
VRGIELCIAEINCDGAGSAKRSTRDGSKPNASATNYCHDIFCCDTAAGHSVYAYG